MDIFHGNHADHVDIYENRSPNMRFFSLFAVLLTLIPAPSPGQERSPVLKDPAAARSPFYLKIDRSTEEMFNAFLLVKKANSGDPVAQHELGLRYLTGDAFTPDTAKAALWIGRAADQQYIPAIFNFGILQNNGWGTPWDPFAAFLKFRTAARKGLVEGEYMYGLLLTDNLVVARDYAGAYRWIKAAADSGYTFAAEVLKDFEKTGIMARIRSVGKDADSPDQRRDPDLDRPVDTSRHSGMPGSSGSGAGSSSPTAPPAQSALQPVFLDMETDTLADPDDATLIEEAFFGDNDSEGGDTSRVAPERPVPDSIDIGRLMAAAAGGSPEALTLAARRAQMGWGIPPDTLEASVYYLRAIRCDSRWSPVLLWRLVNAPGYFDLLKKIITRGEPAQAGKAAAKERAGYVWASLVAKGFDGQLTDPQALGYLRSAAAAEIPDAMVELALCYYAGYSVAADPATGDSLLERAAALGSREAEVRLAMSRLREHPGEGQAPADFETLRKWDEEGSVLAGVILGYCYEGGTGTPTDLPAAVSYYRKAARRGSRLAYDALRRLYDGRRPDDPLFQIPE